jgi:hypothetical protein
MFDQDQRLVHFSKIYSVLSSFEEVGNHPNVPRDTNAKLPDRDGEITKDPN